MTKRHRPAVDEQRPTRRPLGTREDGEQLVLALSLERDDAQHFAREEVEGRVAQPPVVAQVARADARGLLAPRRSCRSGLLVPAAHGGDLAEHELDDPVLRAGSHIDHADRLAVAQDGGARADGGDLDEAVGDEDHRAIAPALATDHIEHAVGQIGRQRGRDLVEQQHLRLKGKRTGQVDDPQRGQGQPPGEA